MYYVLGGYIKLISILLLIGLIFTSCEKNNADIKLITKEMKSKIKNLEATNKSQALKLQNIMNELSVCKASKVKYIETNENFDIIDSNNNRKADRIIPKSTSENSISDNIKLNEKQITKEEIKKEKTFPYPENLKGLCKKSDINRVFHNLRPYLKKCFNNNKIKRGKLGFKWQINENGKVENIKITKNNIFNRNLSNCLTVILKSGRYNSPEQGICEINYIFKLK